MFYLLEDNRIIDSEQYIENLLSPLIVGKDTEKGYEYLYFINEDQAYYLGKVKKQSKNVFDLVEVGDLIKCDRCDGVFEVSDINLFDEEDKEIYECDKSFISYPADEEHLETEISTIYKPNSKGDYIKVWEKK